MQKEIVFSLLVCMFLAIFKNRSKNENRSRDLVFRSHENKNTKKQQNDASGYPLIFPVAFQAKAAISISIELFPQAPLRK